MKKLFYVGLLAYVFWMDEEDKKPFFKAFANIIDKSINLGDRSTSCLGIKAAEIHANKS